MVLTLEVIGQQASKLGASGRRVFNGAGGTIGRLPDNDWVLPDPYISSRHARVDFRDGTYFLVDTSTNGVFVNTPENRLSRSQPYALNNGDRIFIDAYEIRVTIAGPAPSTGPSPLSDLFGGGAMPLSGADPPPQSSGASGRHAALKSSSDPFSNDPFGPIAGAGPLGGGASSGGSARPIIPSDPFGPSQFGNNSGDPFGGIESDSSEGRDPLKLLGLGGPPSSSGPKAEDLGRHSPLQDHYRPPAPVPPPKSAPSIGSAGGFTGGSAGGSAIPDDYDPLSDLLSDSSPSPRGKAAVPPRPTPVQAPHMTTQAQQPTQASPAQGSPPLNQGVARPMPGANRQPTVAPRVTAPLPPSPPHAPPGAKAPARVAQPAQPAAPPPRPAAPRDTAATGRNPQLRNDPAATGTNRQLDMNALLIGAGLTDVQITPELIENFGRILRVVVAGLMDVLRARERIKDEFRMRMTTFKAADNNPLKFSANVDDALHNLLVKRNAAYLGPVEAFDDAFQDVRNHQMAMLAGVRVAFESMLSEFDPERLREQFDRQVKKGSLLAGPAKLRYWELYADKFRGMVNDQESTFRDLFGEEFARAYEEQLERLKAVGRANKK